MRTDVVRPDIFRSIIHMFIKPFPALTQTTKTPQKTKKPPSYVWWRRWESIKLNVNRLKSITKR